MSMKTLLMVTAFFAITSPAFAQQGQAPAQGQRPSPFERADANNDSVITLEEVRAARTAAFTRLDVNRDGFLVREEMPPPPNGRRGGGPDDMQGVPSGDRKMGHRMGHQGGGEMLGRADTNGDGNVTKAEFDAAVASAQQSSASAKQGRRDAMFNRLDTNRDGTITRAEADAIRPQMQGRPHNAGQRPNPDTNNDQKVSLLEWLARPDPLFERGDTNKDGRVTREEAAAFMRDMRSEGGRRQRPW
jgi:Ca2+-binding EF-hand superfamily protein